MPVEAKPLFRPDVLRTHLAGFALPARVDVLRPKLAHWADLLASGKANTFKEQEILPDFLTDFFCELLGYTRPADGRLRYTISREKHVQVDGKFADAVLGDFGRGPDRFIVALWRARDRRTRWTGRSPAVECRPSIKVTATPLTYL